MKEPNRERKSEIKAINNNFELVIFLKKLIIM
jgi:hypothetical protein